MKLIGQAAWQQPGGENAKSNGNADCKNNRKDDHRKIKAGLSPEAIRQPVRKGLKRSVRRIKSRREAARVGVTIGKSQQTPQLPEAKVVPILDGAKQLDMVLTELRHLVLLKAILVKDREDKQRRHDREDAGNQKMDRPEPLKCHAAATENEPRAIQTRKSDSPEADHAQKDTPSQRSLEFYRYHHTLKPMLTHDTPRAVDAVMISGQP